MQIYLVGGLAIRNSYLSPLAKELDRLGYKVKVLALPRNLAPTEYTDYLASRATTAGVWVGHSFGTQLVQEINRKHPQLVTHLVLAGPAEIKISPLHQLMRITHDGFYEPIELVVHAILSVFLTGLKTSWAEAKFSSHLFETKANHSACPALVLHGEKDQFTSYQCSKKLAERLAGEFELITGGARGFVFSHPKETAVLIANFLKISMPTTSS